MRWMAATAATNVLRKTVVYCEARGWFSSEARMVIHFQCVLYTYAGNVRYYGALAHTCQCPLFAPRPATQLMQWAINPRIFQMHVHPKNGEKWHNNAIETQRCDYNSLTIAWYSPSYLSSQAIAGNAGRDPFCICTIFESDIMPHISHTPCRPFFYTDAYPGPGWCIHVCVCVCMRARHGVSYIINGFRSTQIQWRCTKIT